ncbi:hypothetical protein B5X24_HaOG211895 [Helicoverpa armigera]|nr:hypothetical protein B5X24_HaOG211895 [Helicoverpa armigera]
MADVNERNQRLEQLWKNLGLDMHDSGTMMDHPFDLSWNFAYLYKYHARNWIKALQRGENPHDGPEKKQLENLKAHMIAAHLHLPDNAPKLQEKDFDDLFNTIYKL